MDCRRCILDCRSVSIFCSSAAQAADKIAIVNMGNLFQQVAQKTGVSNTLENEFKGRAAELQKMETD
ncbi:hypothetical protein GFK32_21465, partial [Salmonella enterica subsp. enterica serovar Enteritidis]|nr:hypothetical protein [Salmonella enterica subsp. enterica serovar Enteritidis]